MLPKSLRLNLKQEFKLVASGKRIQSPNLTIFLKDSNESFSQVGVATSKQVFKSAVARNRAKRLIFEAIRKNLSNLPSNLKIVIMPRSDLKDLSLQDLEKELKNVPGLLSNH